MKKKCESRGENMGWSHLSSPDGDTITRMRDKA